VIRVLVPLSLLIVSLLVIAAGVAVWLSGRRGGAPDDELPPTILSILVPFVGLIVVVIVVTSLAVALTG
jgi:uncharacterized membrane protein YidH (DUF202 family)